MIKVKWDVEEIVALIDLYQRANEKMNSNFDFELLELSRTLNKRAYKLGIIHDEKFRNLNRLQLMYKKIMYLATKGEKGLKPTNKSFVAIYEMYLGYAERWLYRRPAYGYYSCFKLSTYRVWLDSADL